VRLRPYLRSVWERREFALALPSGDLKAQNMDTLFGGLWHLLNPLLLVGVYYIVFGLILQTENRGRVNFIAFLTVGIFVFFYTRKSIQAGARTLVVNLPLIRSIKFPRAVLPIAAVIGETIALGPALVCMAIVTLFAGAVPRLAWLLVVPALVMQLAFNLGAACCAARLTDHFRDVQQLIPYLMTIWMYLSGVLYDVDTFIDDPLVLWVFKLNPMYAYVELVRDALLDGTTDWRLWVSGAGWAVVVLVAGFAFFRRREHAYGRG
jgi:teichoic acid transport system permease protein